MDERKIIKKYICPGTWMTVVGILLAVVLAVSVVMGLAALGADQGEVPEFYQDDSSEGTMAYVDVVGVSPWLYKYDDATYYGAEDAEGYVYTVRLTDRQYANMSAQQEYWFRDDDNTPVPDAYHLEGYVRTTSSSLRRNLAEVWEISEEEYGYYFGSHYLDGTTSVAAENSAVWFVIAMMSGIFAVVCLIVTIRAGSVAKKCLARLEERALIEKAARQLQFTEAHTVIGKKRGILTQDFLFGKGTGVVVAYDDILWAYQRDQRRNFVVANSYLMVATRFMSAKNAIDMNRADRKGYIGDALAIISQHNPYTLLGFTNENRKACNAMMKGQLF